MLFFFFFFFCKSVEFCFSTTPVNTFISVHLPFLLLLVFLSRVWCDVAFCGFRDNGIVLECVLFCLLICSKLSLVLYVFHDLFVALAVALLNVRFDLKSLISNFYFFFGIKVHFTT